MQKPPHMPGNPIVDPILSLIRRRCTGREDNKRRDARERAPRRCLTQMVKARRRGRLLADLRLGIVLAVLLPQGLALLLAVVERLAVGLPVLRLAVWRVLGMLPELRLPVLGLRVLVRLAVLVLLVLTLLAAHLHLRHLHGLLARLGDLVELLVVHLDGLLVRLGRGVQPPLLQPPVVLLGHVQMLPGQLLQEASRRLGRLGGAPHALDGHGLALLEALPGCQHVDGVLALAGHTGLAALARGTHERTLPSLPRGLPRLGRAHGLGLGYAVVQEAVQLLGHLLEALGVLLHHRAQVGILHSLGHPQELGPCQVVVPGDLPQFGCLVLRDVGQSDSSLKDVVAHSMRRALGPSCLPVPQMSAAGLRPKRVSSVRRSFSSRENWRMCTSRWPSQRNTDQYCCVERYRGSWPTWWAADARSLGPGSAAAKSCRGGCHCRGRAWPRRPATARSHRYSVACSRGTWMAKLSSTNRGSPAQSSMRRQ